MDKICRGNIGLCDNHDHLLPLVQKTKALLFDVNFCLKGNKHRNEIKSILKEGGGYDVFGEENDDSPDSSARVPQNFNARLWLNYASGFLFKTLPELDSGQKFKKEVINLIDEIESSL